MEITYTKSYRQEEFDNFIIYDDLGYKDTNVFYEYKGLVSRNKDKSREELLKLVEEFKPQAKSKLRWSLENSVLSFFPPNKYIFPKFYVIFK